MTKHIRSFSEGITTGSRQTFRITKSFQETPVRFISPKFEKQSKEFIKRFGTTHPKGLFAFIQGLDKGLKYGIKPAELERAYRTWIYNNGVVGDVRQGKILEKFWPGLKNKISKVGPPWRGTTIYGKEISPHKEGLHKGTYAEKVSTKRAQAEMNYHPAVGYY